MPRKTRRKARKTPREQFARPTQERENHNQTRSAGAARQIIPVIETLLDRKKITHSEFYALHHYRQTAIQAQDDARQSGTLDPARIMACTGHTAATSAIPAGLAFTPAQYELSRLNRLLGGLRPVTEAMAVDDISPNRWCIQQFGGREEKDRGTISMRPNGGRSAIQGQIERLKEAAWIIRDALS